MQIDEIVTRLQDSVNDSDVQALMEALIHEGYYPDISHAFLSLKADVATAMFRLDTDAANLLVMRFCEYTGGDASHERMMKRHVFKLAEWVQDGVDHPRAIDRITTAVKGLYYQGRIDEELTNSVLIPCGESVP